MLSAFSWKRTEYLRVWVSPNVRDEETAVILTESIIANPLFYLYLITTLISLTALMHQLAVPRAAAV